MTGWPPVQVSDEGSVRPVVWIRSALCVQTSPAALHGLLRRHQLQKRGIRLLAIQTIEGGLLL